MLVMCNNYVNTIRFKGNGFLDYPNDFNFRLNSKIGNMQKNIKRFPNRNLYILLVTNNYL